MGCGLEAGGWRLEAGSWRLEAGGWKLEAGGWRLEAGVWRLEAGGWKKLEKNCGLRRFLGAQGKAMGRAKGPNGGLKLLRVGGLCSPSPGLPLGPWNYLKPP